MAKEAQQSQQVEVPSLKVTGGQRIFVRMLFQGMEPFQVTVSGMLLEEIGQ